MQQLVDAMSPEPSIRIQSEEIIPSVKTVSNTDEVEQQDIDDNERADLELLTALKEDIAESKAEQQSSQEMNELILFIVVGLLGALILIVCVLIMVVMSNKKAQQQSMVQSSVQQSRMVEMN